MPLLALKMLEVGGDTIKDAVISFFKSICKRLHRKKTAPIIIEAVNSNIILILYKD